MKMLVSATILLISVTNVPAQAPVAATAPVPPSPVPQWSAAASSGQALSTSNSTVILGSQVQQTGDLEDQARETVLVVPGPDLKPEALATVTEDMTVMCRIFDKAINPAARSGRSVYMRTGDLPLLNRLLVQQAGRTQGLYLDGYGAVFFVHVDFPLVPPPQQTQESKPDESADRVWSQTMNELRGQPQTRDADESGPAYDAQKVENLKLALIKTLRHAANLRIRPQDQITVVAGGNSRNPAVASKLDTLRYLRSSGYRVPRPMPRNAGRADLPGLDPAATLVLRIVKSDLDALGAGKATPEQIVPKVQTFWSWTQPQPQPTTTQPPAAIPAPAPR
jgi:hypothetical protein